jgi:tetratricopeptide (TPR) repeat protein
MIPKANVNSSKSNKIVFAVLLSGVCLTVGLIMWPSLSSKAQCYDDNQYVFDNLLVKHPGVSSAWRFLTEVLNPSTVSGYYQPLAMVSLMLDTAMGGRADNFYPYHLTSLVLHILNTVLIAILLYLLFDNVWVVCGVALLFGSHSLAIEPVTWLGERKTMLAAFFSFCCLVAYVRFVQKGDRRRFFLVAILYILALMSKPTSTPLPAVMLLLDFWPLGRFGKKSVFEKIPLFVLGAISAVITIVSQTNTASVSTPQEYGGLSRVFMVFGHDISFYLVKMFCPMNLSPHYAFPDPLNLSNPTVRAYVLASIVFIVFLVILLRWTKVPLVGWLIFLVTIMPTMQTLQFSNVIASDKFAYLPSVGILLVLAWVMARLWIKETGAGVAIKRVSIVLAVLVLAGAEAVGTRHQLRYWRDTITLYGRMVVISPWSIPPRDNMAIAMAVSGDLDGALKELETAYAMDPNSPQTMDALGTVMANKGRQAEALEWHLKAIDINPRMDGPQYNAAVTLMKLGRTQEAIPYCKRAVALKPGWPEAHMQLGIALAKTGDNAGAEVALKKAVELEPALRRAHMELAAVYVQQTRWSDAAEQYRQGIELKSDYDSLINLGSALVEAGRLSEAERYYREAIAMKPDAAISYCNLAVILAKQGNVTEATDLVNKALQVEPDNEQAQRYLRMLTNGGQNAQKK